MEDKQVFTGTVIWFSNNRGYGYIKPDEGEKDWFIHWSQICKEGYKTLTKGQKVSYVVGANDRGPQAEQVTVLE